MRKGTLRAAMLVFILIPTMANAQSYKVMGGGIASCGDWVSSKDPLRIQLAHWVLGFVTAMNVNRAASMPGIENADVVNGANGDAIEGWITDYCTQNPLKNVAQAAVELYKEASK